MQRARGNLRRGRARDIAAPSRGADNTGRPPPEWAANAAAGRRTTTISPTRGRRRARRSTRSTVAKLKVEVALRIARHELVRRLRVHADRARRHRLPAGPELERLRARPRERPRCAGSTRSTSRTSARTASPTAGGASTARRRRMRSRSIPKTGSCCGRGSIVRNEHEGIEIAPQLYDRTVLFSTVPSNVTGSYRPGDARRRLGARRRDRQAEVEVRHGRGRRRAVGQARCQRRRRPVVSAGGRRPRPRLPRRRQSGAVPRHEGVPERLEPAGPEPLHELARGARRGDRASCSGTGRRCRTTCATTTSRSRPS